MRKELISLMMVAGLAAFATGLVVSGMAYGARRAAERHAYEAARDAKIVDEIVRANPDASIRDFGGDFASFLVKAAAAKGVDYRLLMAIIDKESGWNPKAVGADGEVGLGQMLPKTAALVAKRLPDVPYTPPRGFRASHRTYSDIGSLAEPKIAVAFMLEYLAWQVQRYGAVDETALRAYNRNPDRAQEHWPQDRYAEDVSKRFLRLAHAIR